MTISCITSATLRPRNKNACIGILIFSFLLLAYTKIRAQTYPVQVSLQLIPPFSGYITDYSAPGNDNLRAYVLNNDFAHPSYDVKFKIKIEGQGIVLQSAYWYFSDAFALTPGVPLMLSSIDFAGLLNENNLEFSGITRAQYDQRRILPEGFYTISLIAYDNVNPIPIQVSNEGMTQAWMTLNDPPFLNFPICGNEIQVIDPQQITFSWTAVNVNVPWNSLGTEYKFELWEIFPTNQSAGNIVASTAPIYTVTTNLTMINYGITEPQLIVGRQYVWRVTARDLDDRALFRNNGISQLCTFTWGNTSSLLGNIANLTLNVQPLTHRQARASWDSLGVYAQYHLRFRKANTSSNWFTYTTPNRTLRICDLEPETDYVAMVQGVFPNGDPGNWSAIVTFHTPAQQLLNCGDVAVPPANQNFRPLTQANTGMIWQVGQFEMSVTALSNTQSGAGWYSGFGKIILPFGVTLNVGYTNIQIGDDEVMYSGEVRALTEGMTEWIAQYNSSGSIDPEIDFNSEIQNSSEIHVDTLSEEITIDGHTFTYDSDEGTAIEDASGSLYIVTSDGTVIYAGETNVSFNPPPPDYINSAYGTATFSPNNSQLYGYDKNTIPQWSDYYGTVNDIADNNSHIVDFKSVQKGKYDVVDVTLTNLDSVSPDSIFFYCPSGTIYANHGSGMNRKLYLVGGKDKDMQNIYAGFYNSNHQLVNIGKINVVSFEEETKTLWLVPFGNTAAISSSLISQVQVQLDSMYKGGVIKWSVRTNSQLFTVNNWDENADGKIDVHSVGLNKYSNEMSNICSALNFQPWFSANDNYLFISSIQPDSAGNNLNGEMPRNRKYGFVFIPPSDPQFSRVVAHECGHGVFALEHSFEGNAPAPQNTTNDLMDYSGGKSLVEWQWMWMHNPAGWTGGDDNGDAASATVNLAALLPLINEDNTTFTFYAPSGNPITIPSGGLTNVTFSYGDEYRGKCTTDSAHTIYHQNPVGCLSSFILYGKKYDSGAQCDDNNFLCYNSGTEVYHDVYSPSLHPGSGIIGLPMMENGQLVFKVFKQNFVSIPEYPEQNYTALGTIMDHIVDPNNTSIANAGTVEAIISPPYSADALDYMDESFRALGANSVLSSYVLTYACQINEYPETYVGCIKGHDGDMTPDALPPSLSSAQQLLLTNEQDIETEVEEFRNNTALKFYYIDLGRRYVNAYIESINDPLTMVTKLNNQMSYDCYWKSLSGASRVHAIEVLGQGLAQGLISPYQKTYSDFILLILATTSSISQQDTILQGLSWNNCQDLQMLWANLTGSALDEFVNLVSGWHISSSGTRPDFNSLAGQAFYSSSSSFTPDIRYFEFYPQYTSANASHYYFNTSGDWIANSDQIRISTTFDPDGEGSSAERATRELTLGAYDWVAVKIMEDLPQVGLKANTTMVVPMCWAKWLSERITNTFLSDVKNVITQFVLIAATDGLGELFDGFFVAVNSTATMEARMVGSEMEAVVSYNTTVGDVAGFEVGADGKVVLKDLKWGEKSDINGVEVGKIENTKYYRSNGEQLTGDLQIIMRSDGSYFVREVIAYDPVYTAQYIQGLNGFSDQLPTILAEENITMQQYLDMELKAATDLNPDEWAMMQRIRARVAMPDGNTVMMKCVPPADVPKYLSGQYSSIGGFVTTVKDAKQLANCTEIYEGLRLDYSGTPYTGNEESIMVIRFKTSYTSNLEVPQGLQYAEEHNLSYPFTGTGMTSGMNGVPGSPEWKLIDYVKMKDQAEMWSIDKSGNQTLFAVFDENLGKFVLVK